MQELMVEAVADYLRVEFPDATISHAHDEWSGKEVFAVCHGDFVRYIELTKEWSNPDCVVIPIERALREWGIARVLRGVIQGGTLSVTPTTIRLKV